MLNVCRETFTDWPMKKWLVLLYLFWSMVLKPLVKPELNIYVHIEKVVNSYNTDRVNIWALYSVSNDFCLNSIPDIVKMSPLLYGRCCACVSTYVRCTNVPTRGKIGIVWFEKWFYNWSVWWFCLYSLHVAMVFKFLILIISALLYTVYLLYIHNLCLRFEKSSNIDMLTHQLLLE